MLAFALCLPLVLPVAGDLLQPATYASPSGEWTPHVDPSSKVGAGPADVVVARGGETVWAREWPLTFRSAVIDDAGRVAGWGFREEPRSYERVLRVQVVSPAGELLLEDERACDGSSAPGAGPTPWVAGDYLQPTLGHYVVRVVDRTRSPEAEEWWVFGLDPARRLLLAHPQLGLERPDAIVCSQAARAVPGTPLAITLWYHVDFSRPGRTELGARYALLDADLAPVWELGLQRSYPDDDRAASGRVRNAIWSTREILDAPGPRRFELREFAEEQRVTFGVARDETPRAGWEVRELARSSYVTEEPRLETLEPRRLSTVAFEATAQPGMIHFDGQGRVVVEDERTRALHVFDEGGRRLRVCTPAPEDGARIDEYWDVVAAPDGRLYAQTGHYEDRFLEFAPDARRVGWTELGGELVAFARSSTARWVARSSYAETTLRRFDAAGAEGEPVERSAGRTFLDQVRAFGCAPDGAPCAIDGPIDTMSLIGSDYALHLWAADGTPERRIELPPGHHARWRRLARRGDRVLASSFTRWALLVSIPVGCTSMVAGPPEAGHYAFTLSPDGRELWCATTEPLALHRYALPD